MKRTLTGLWVIIQMILIFPSCQKNGVTVTNPKIDSINIFGFVDSTMLIKSITYTNPDSTGTEYFFYDTVNRKIIVSLQPVSVVGGNYTDGQEFSYDNYGMLVHINGKFSVPEDVYFTSADYTYDDQHVLSSANTATSSGYNYAASYTKTAVPGGYLLSELYTTPAVNGYIDSNYSAALVDDSGRLSAFYTIVNNTEPGDPHNTSANGDTYFYNIDSLIYDAAGNLMKEMVTYPPDQLKPDSLVTFARYDFPSRDVRGDQLHNLGKILFRGIGHLPFTIIDFFAGELSQMGDDGMQVNKFPALQTTFIAADSNGIFNIVYHYNTPARYDEQNRLIGYHNFAHYPPFTAYDISITYYK
jgi:hypothetical protein